MLDWKSAEWACTNYVDKDATLVMVDQVLETEYNWIDLHYVSSQWVRADGSKPTATHWEANQPDLRFGKCAGFNRFTGLWWAAPCDQKLGVVCQQSGSTPTTPAPGSSRSQCQALADGADLVSVHSDAEKKAVEAMVAGAGGAAVWTGLEYVSQGLAWTDGSETAYIKPLVTGHVVPGADCVQLTADGHWRWQGCDKSFGFVCLLTST
ncbi:uncharacterized protein LOC119113439 [Pollicipes pollicipes]|uniref:uncharacterized protein LOC119113439 n=1 Tax=Pollicipes pollicipes TaxID=41117 RepID=UPI0018850948|nr:uncharacterized protein LOC119113439 [Pollicipes pollicipes]